MITDINTKNLEDEKTKKNYDKVVNIIKVMKHNVNMEMYCYFYSYENLEPISPNTVFNGDWKNEYVGSRYSWNGEKWAPHIEGYDLMWDQHEKHRIELDVIMLLEYIIITNRVLTADPLQLH